MSFEVDTFRVLAVDNEPQVLSEIELHLEVDGFELYTATRPQDAQGILTESHIDAAIIDLEMPAGGEGGREVLRLMRVHAPYAYTVVATQHTDRSNQLVGIRFPRLGAVIQKGHEDTPEDWPIECLRAEHTLWQQRHVTIENLDLAVSLLRARAERIPRFRRDDLEVAVEIDRLARQVFGTVALDESNAVIVALSPIQREGLSAAITLNAEIRLGRDEARRPLPPTRAVVKIGPIEDIDRERERYHRFVKFGVPLRHRVEMMGSARGQALGMICYSYAADGVYETPQTLDELLLHDSGEGAPAGVAVYELFQRESKRWYGVTGKKAPPAGWVRRTWRPNFAHCDEQLVRSLRTAEELVGEGCTIQTPDHSTSGRLVLEGASLVIPPFGYRGTGPFQPSRPTRLVHGDMHGGNVMVEQVGGLYRPRLIDYASAGFGPRLADFVMLEASIRLVDAQRLAQECGLPREPDLYERESVEALDASAIRQALKQCVLRVREERKLVKAWAGESLRNPPTDPWAIRSLQLSSLAAENFDDDPLAVDEYLTMAVLTAHRHLGLRIGLLAQVRFMAWASAAYEALSRD